MAHHSIFREELGGAYPSYGLALWESGSGGQYDAVEVGDVGLMVSLAKSQWLFPALVQCSTS